MVNNEEMVSQEPFFFWRNKAAATATTTWAASTRSRRVYGWINALSQCALLLILSLLVYMKRNTPQYWCFFICFHDFYTDKNESFSAWWALREIGLSRIDPSYCRGFILAKQRILHSLTFCILGTRCKIYAALAACRNAFFEANRLICRYK